MCPSPDSESQGALRKGPLHRWHRDRGAILAPLGDYQAVLHYGDWQAESNVLAKGVGLLDRTAFSRLELLGEDRARFLNGLVTIDVPKLEPGDGAFGYLTAVKGGILADVTVYALEDRLWVDMAPGREQAVRQHLEKYIVADRVEVVALDEMVPLAVLGEGFASEALGRDLPATEYGHKRIKLWGTEVHLAHTSRLGLPGVVLWASASIVDLFALDLLENLAGTGGEPLSLVGIEAWQQQRIRKGVPLFGVDFDDKTLPQELDDSLGLDFEKGCYLGQEVIARLHYRGQTPRQLRQVKGPSGELPAVGSELSHEGRAVGTLTSVTTGETGGWVGLSRIARRAFDSGTRLELAAGGEALVV